jgi:LPXTG-site transpeptidase (sortase) family protein
MLQRRWSVWIGGALIAGGAALLTWYGWTMHERAAAQRRAKEWLIRTTAVHQPALASTASRGDVIGQLEIPRLGVSVMVFEGDDAGILRQGAGHIPGTVDSPGNGNIGVAAHRDSYFRPLGAIHVNDLIALKTPEGTSKFAVTEAKIVQPSDVGVLARAPGRDLTLVTCYPFFYVGSAPERFIVHARLIKRQDESLPTGASVPDHL